jgi:peptidoglycan-associated lipoprotein
MKLTKIFNLMMLGLILTFTAVGCRHNPYGVTPINGRNPPAIDPNSLNGGNRIGNGLGNGIENNSTPVAMNGNGIPPNAAGTHEGWPENREALKQQAVYFDFDKSSIKSSEGSKLDEVASYLKSHPEVAVKVEGNCDERGTEEYNRSLGERRALAAREHLVRLGIDAGRVDTITYGEDKPAETGHSEAAWSKNRRDDFIILTAPGKF